MRACAANRRCSSSSAGGFICELTTDPGLHDTGLVVRIEVSVEDDEVGTLAGRERATLMLLAAGVGGACRVGVQPLFVAERLLGCEDTTRAGAAGGAVRGCAQRLVKGARVVGRRCERDAGAARSPKGSQISSSHGTLSTD